MPLRPASRRRRSRYSRSQALPLLRARSSRQAAARVRGRGARRWRRQSTRRRAAPSTTPIRRNRRAGTTYKETRCSRTVPAQVPLPPKTRLRRPNPAPHRTTRPPWRKRAAPKCQAIAQSSIRTERGREGSRRAVPTPAGTASDGQDAISRRVRRPWPIGWIKRPTIGAPKSIPSSRGSDAVIKCE